MICTEHDVHGFIPMDKSIVDVEKEPEPNRNALTLKNPKIELELQ
jgi:hypothetical protein